MTTWTRAVNPTSPLTTEAEALAAARASALAIFLGVLWGVVGMIALFAGGQAAIEAAAAQVAADTPEASAFAAMLPQIVLAISAFFLLLQLLLGVIQWVWPNIVIPILFVILVAIGLISAALGAVGSQAAAATTPAWMTGIGVVLLIVQLVLHVAGIRGASALRRLRAQVVVG